MPLARQAVLGLHDLSPFEREAGTVIKKTSLSLQGVFFFTVGGGDGVGGMGICVFCGSGVGGLRRSGRRLVRRLVGFAVDLRFDWKGRHRRSEIVRCRSCPRHAGSSGRLILILGVRRWLRARCRGYATGELWAVSEESEGTVVCGG